MELFPVLSKCIHERSTSKDFDGSSIDDSLIESLLDLAIRAPNHHLTQPWQFRVMTPIGIRAWLQSLESRLPPDEWKLLRKAADRLQNVGALIFVHVKKASDEKRAFEDLLTMGAATQNILLGATALGLGSYWSTARIHDHPLTRTYLGLKDDEWIVGAVWLGRGALSAPSERIPATEKTRWFRGERIDITGA